jgi:hypothetical protein
MAAACVLSSVSYTIQECVSTRVPENIGRKTTANGKNPSISIINFLFSIVTHGKDLYL